MKLGRLLLYSLFFSCLAFSQAAPDNEQIWHDFVGWVKAQHNIADLNGDKYRASLIQGGLTPAQADERMKVIGKLYPDRRAEVDIVAENLLYASPNPTRFTTDPNAFLVRAAKGLKPGKALDVAMGQGRNAVYLATQGWDVTGFDIADEGLRVANENAAKAGVGIHTVHARFEDFDYGKERWDMIYFVYTDAPVVDPKFVEKIVAALKPGGYLLMERPFKDLDNPDPDWRAPLVDWDKPNALAKAWSDLRILLYEDTTGIGEWQQTKTNRLEKQLRIVRLLARKATNS